MKRYVLKSVARIALFVAMVTGWNDVKAQTAGGETWEVEVDIYSGRPNPVFTLTAGEMTSVNNLIAAAPAAARASTDGKSIRPRVLGYRGLIIRSRSADGRLTAMNVEISRGRILRRASAVAAAAPGADASTALLDDSGRAVERFLVSLGSAKKVITADILQRMDPALR